MIGDYEKTVYINGSTPAINATNLNKNEDKTAELDTWAAAADEQINKPTYSGSIYNTASIFSTGTGTDKDGNPVDVSASIKDVMVKECKTVGDTYENGVTTLPHCIRSVGKNLFDAYDYVRNVTHTPKPYIDEDGFLMHVPGGSGYNYTACPVYYFAAGTYTVSQIFKTTGHTRRVILYDLSGNIIYDDTSSGSSTFTIAQSGYYYLKVFSPTNGGIKLQLEVGATATDYEPHKSDEVYCPVELHKVPNGKCDKYDFLTGTHDKRVNKYVLKAEDIVEMATYTNNIEIAETREFYDGYQHDFVNDNAIVEGWELISQVQFQDSTEFIGSVLFNIYKKFLFIFPKGTTLQQAKNALAGLTIIYQLETPETYYYPPQALQVFENGTVYVETINTDYGFYDSGLTISNTNIPIDTLVEVLKFDSDTGAATEIPVNTCTVAGNGLSFTSTALTYGDLVWFAYEYDSSLSAPGTVIMDYPLNTAAQIVANSRAIGVVDRKAEDIRRYAELGFERMENAFGINSGRASLTGTIAANSTLTKTIALGAPDYTEGSCVIGGGNSGILVFFTTDREEAFVVGHVQDYDGNRWGSAWSRAREGCITNKLGSSSGALALGHLATGHYGITIDDVYINGSNLTIVYRNNLETSEPLDNRVDWRVKKK